MGVLAPLKRRVIVNPYIEGASMRNHSNANFSISSSGTFIKERNFTEKELLKLAAKQKG